MREHYKDIRSLLMTYHEAKATSGSARNVRISKESVGGGVHSNGLEDKYNFICDVEYFLRTFMDWEIKILLSRICPDDAQRSWRGLAQDFMNGHCPSAPKKLKHQENVRHEFYRLRDCAHYYFLGRGYIREEPTR